MIRFCHRLQGGFLVGLVADLVPDALCFRHGLQLRLCPAEAKQQGQDYQVLLGHASRSMSDKYIKRREIERVEPVKLRLKS